MMQIAHDRWIPWRLGIDVGVSGCIAAYNTETTELRLIELPYRRRPLVNPRGKRKFESVPMPAAWLNMLDEYAGARAIVEDIAALAGHYAYSEAALMESYGMIQMAAAAKRIDLVTVHPTTWKAFMLRGRGGHKAEKAESVLMARELFPSAVPVLLKSKDGRADALNLLYYDMLGEARRHERKALKQAPQAPVQALCTGLIKREISEIQ